MAVRTTPATPHPSALTDKQICTFIAESCAELRQIARRPRLRTISYLLDMARLEADRMAKELPD